MAFLGTTIRADELPGINRRRLSANPSRRVHCQYCGGGSTPTKDGTGRYINLKSTVIAPTHQGRVLFSKLNIRNQSAKAEEIGLQQLGAVMRAPFAHHRRQRPTDCGTLIARVDIRTSEQYGAQNEVKAL